MSTETLWNALECFGEDAALAGRGKTVMLWACAAGLVLGGCPLRAQQTEGAGLQMSTQERLEIEAWWPTKSNGPLASFAGSAACAGCHTQEIAGRPSAMQRAAVMAKDAKFLSARPVVSAAGQPLTYYLAASAAGLEYTVSDGPHRLSQKLDWVMGAGGLGRTFLYEAEGRWYQSEMTYYKAEPALDVTTGLERATGANLVTALGQVLSAGDARRCFSCHTVHATSSAGFNPLHAEAGLGCEACHGPGLAHVKTMAAVATAGAGAGAGGAAATSSAVFNPARLSPVDSIDFCGACHRTFVDATLSIGQATSTAVVRFQPYRLEESKCWRATQDSRLTCVACHDPHAALNRDAASYDKHCVQCHSTAAVAAAPEHAAKVCPKATSQCVTCHMPKVALASMHGAFTDHQIRVVRAGEAFPR